MNNNNNSQRRMRVPMVVERPDRYGWVDGLEPDEHADPDELERQAFLAFWAPVLQLPKRRTHSGPRPTIDESGRLDFGAFGTVDYERLHGPFDKARYRREKLREQLEDVLITLSIVAERLPGRAKYQVLGYLRRGVIDSEQIVDDDMRAFARLTQRAERLRQEIAAISRYRRNREVAAEVEAGE